MCFSSILLFMFKTFKFAWNHNKILVCSIYAGPVKKGKKLIKQTKLDIISFKAYLFKSNHLKTTRSVISFDLVYGEFLNFLAENWALVNWKYTSSMSACTGVPGTQFPCSEIKDLYVIDHKRSLN